MSFDSSRCPSGLTRRDDEEDLWREEERCLLLDGGPLCREVAVLMLSSLAVLLLLSEGSSNDL